MSTNLLYAERLDPDIDHNQRLSSLVPAPLFDARRTAQQGIIAASTAPRWNLMVSFASQVPDISSQDIAHWRAVDDIMSPLCSQGPLYAGYSQASAMQPCSTFSPFDSTLLSGLPLTNLLPNSMNIYARPETTPAFAVQNGYQRIIPHQNPTATHPTDRAEIREPSITRWMDSSSVPDVTYSYLPSDLSINTAAVVYDIHPSRCQWGDACDAILDDLSARGIIHHLKARHFPDKHWIGHRGPCQWEHCGKEMDFLSYGKHVETVHLRGTTVICDRCTKFYTRPDSLKRHQKQCG